MWKCALRTPNLRLEPRMFVSLNVSQREHVTCEVCCSQYSDCEEHRFDLCIGQFRLITCTRVRFSHRAERHIRRIFAGCISVWSEQQSANVWSFYRSDLSHARRVIISQCWCKGSSVCTTVTQEENCTQDWRNCRQHQTCVGVPTQTTCAWLKTL